MEAHNMVDSASTIFVIVYIMHTTSTWVCQETEISICESYNEVNKEREKLIDSYPKYTSGNLIIRIRDLRFGEGLWY